MPIALSDTLNLGDVFNKRIPYVIPRHQRTYSWTDDEVEDFCKDIKRVFASTGRHYFFGGIVLVDKKTSGAHGRQMIVIDGQQRLSTFMLFLANIRNAYKEIERKAKKAKLEETQSLAEKLRVDLEEKYMFYLDNTVRPPEQRDRLTLSEIDEKYFHDLINEEKTPKPTEKSHKLLSYAYKEIEREIINPIFDTFPELDKVADKLLEYQSAFLDSCFLTHIVCDSEDDAFLLFEVLNDRGKDLATCDHLRNWTLQKTSGYTAIQSEIAGCWDVISESEGTEKFLKSIVQSFSFRRPGRILHQEIRAEILKAPEKVTLDDATNLKQQVVRIKENLATYSNLSKGDWPYKEGKANLWTRTALELLVRRLRHVLCIPLLMCAYETKDEKFFGELIKVLMRFVARYINICALRASKVDAAYMKIIENLRKNPDEVNIESISSLFDALIKNDATDTIFEEGLKRLDYQTNDEIIRFLLLMIEYHRSWLSTTATKPKPDESVVIDLKDLHLEHIYPQSPDPSSAVPEMEQIKHSIGNLTIMRSSDNRAASNSPFNAKKEFYRASSVAITRDLESIEEWDVKSYNIRQSNLITSALKVFAP